MQDGLVGDFGDFTKYGLLRQLFGKPEDPQTRDPYLRLGVVWYFNQTGAKLKCHLNEYSHLQYLDPFLFERLGILVGNQSRR